MKEVNLQNLQVTRSWVGYVFSASGPNLGRACSVLCPLPGTGPPVGMLSFQEDEMGAALFMMSRFTYI